MFFAHTLQQLKRTLHLVLPTCFFFLKIILCYMFKLKKKTHEKENTHIRKWSLMSVHALVILQQLQWANLLSGRKIKQRLLVYLDLST